MGSLAQSFSASRARLVPIARLWFSDPGETADKPGKIEDIEFLRAVAIVVVTISHLPALFGWYGAGLTEVQATLNFGNGVDLFFVISGFVIARSFLRNFDRNGPNGLLRSAAPFWIRRIFRIIPAAWFWIFFSLFAVVFLNQSGAFGAFVPTYSDALAAVLQVANIHSWECNYGIKPVCAIGGVPNGIYWTLSLEEQFYLLFPFVMVFTPRRWLVPLLATAAAIQMFLPLGTFAPFIRSHGLIAGVLLALASQHPLYQMLDPRILARPLWKWTAFFVLLALSLTITSATFSVVPFKSGMLTFVLAAWVFIASFGKGYAFPGGGHSRVKAVLLWIGARSYGLYLCHFCAFCLTREIWFRLGFVGVDGSATLAYGLTAAVLLYLFAEGTYRMIERPCQARGHVLSQRVRANLTPPAASPVTGHPDVVVLKQN
jgi:peptidoglycan/LPS O-acetylase OafA/YrhL